MDFNVGGKTMVPWGSIFGLVIGLIMIIKGADVFIDAAIWIAQKTGIPKVIIGISIVSLATTLPEFSVSVYASYTNHASMAVGNAVGSCICNIGLILGMVLIYRQFKVEQKGFVNRGVYMIVVAGALFLMSQDFTIGRADAIVLIFFLAGFVYLIYNEVRNSVEREITEVEGKWGIQIIKFILSSLLVVIGSRLVVNSGVTLAEFFHIPEIVISLTLIALGTSLPELVTALTAAYKGHQDLSLGNIVGANILNMTWVVGGSALINPLSISPQNIRIDLPVMAAFMVLLLIFGKTKNVLGRFEGAILFMGYFAYIAFTILS